MPPSSGGTGREDRPRAGQRDLAPKAFTTSSGDSAPSLAGSGNAWSDWFSARGTDMRTAGTQNSSARITPASMEESHPLGVIRSDRNETCRTQAP